MQKPNYPTEWINGNSVEPTHLATSSSGSGAGPKCGLAEVWFVYQCQCLLCLNINRYNSGLMAGWDFKDGANNPSYLLVHWCQFHSHGHKHKRLLGCGDILCLPASKEGITCYAPGQVSIPNSCHCLAPRIRKWPCNWLTKFLTIYQLALMSWERRAVAHPWLK